MLICGLFIRHFTMKKHIITTACMALALAPLSQAQEPAPAAPQAETPAVRIYVSGTELPAEIAEDIMKNGVLAELLSPVKRTDTAAPEEGECTCAPECRCGEEEGAPTCSEPAAAPAEPAAPVSSEPAAPAASGEPAVPATPSVPASAEVKVSADGVVKIIVNGKEVESKNIKVIRMRIRTGEDGKPVAEPVE